jgi:hypothetical protein
MQALKGVEALPTWRLVHSRDTQERGEINISLLQKKAYNILGGRCDATRLPVAVLECSSLACPGAVRWHDWLNRCSITGLVGARWEPSRWCRSKKTAASFTYSARTNGEDTAAPVGRMTVGDWRDPSISILRGVLILAREGSVVGPSVAGKKQPSYLTCSGRDLSMTGRSLSTKGRNNLKSRRSWWEEERCFSVDIKRFARARFRIHLTTVLGAQLSLSGWDIPLPSVQELRTFMSVSHMVGHGSETFASASAQPTDFKSTSVKRVLLYLRSSV